MIDCSDLIGVPFKEFGRDPRTGLDCYGLAIEVARRYGKTLKDVVMNRMSCEQAERTIDMHINIFKTTDIMRPCIVLEFRTIQENTLHAGITIDEHGTFLQATRTQGVRISTIDSCRGYLRFRQAFEILDCKEGQERQWKQSITI